MNREAGLVNQPRATQPSKCSISDGGENFILFTKCRQLWVPSGLLFSGRWGFPREIKRHGPEADHSHYIVTRLRMNGVIPPLSNTLSWRAQGQPYLCLPNKFQNYLLAWYIRKSNSK